MSIRLIRLDQFNALHPPRPPGFKAILEEREWYVDEQTKVLGIIVYYLTENDWAIVVLRRVGAGAAFVTSLAEIRMGTIEQARTRLFDAMHRALRHAA